MEGMEFVFNTGMNLFECDETEVVECGGSEVVECDERDQVENSVQRALVL